MPDALKPCPFCGTTPSEHEIEFGGVPFWIVTCCMVDTRRQRTKADAIAAWNRRAPPPPEGGK